MDETVRIRTRAGDVLFELTDEGLFLYVDHDGGRHVPRGKAKRLKRALKRWLDLTGSKGGR